MIIPNIVLDQATGAVHRPNAQGQIKLRGMKSPVLAREMPDGQIVITEGEDIQASVRALKARGHKVEDAVVTIRSER